MKSDKKSPIKDKPLRNPGQSLDEQRFDLAYDNLLGPAMLALVMVLISGLEWWNFYHPNPNAPFIYTIFAVVLIFYAAWKVWRTLPKLRQLRQAAEGEKVVGQFLERLRGNGYQVFHDIVGEGFNLDHILIGPAGVFTVETKTLSKPSRGDARIVYDGERITADGFELDRNPVIQAKAQARWLYGLLKESTGKSFAIRPIVVFPGWYVEYAPGAGRDIWVLEPKALPSYLAKEPAALTSEDIRLASYHLSRFIRQSEKTAA